MNWFLNLAEDEYEINLEVEYYTNNNLSFNYKMWYLANFIV